MADDVAAVRQYLGAVYPAASARLARLSPQEVTQFFHSLDYFYSFSPEAQASVRPPLLRAPTGQEAPPLLPYLPSGAYYHAHGSAPTDRGRFNAILWGSFDRHTEPVIILPDVLPGEQAARFRSSFGARMGPQPSWTSPFATVRYVHFPNGLQLQPPSAQPSKLHVESLNGFFDVEQLSRWNASGSAGSLRAAALPADGSLLGRQCASAIRADVVSRLRQLRDGDFVEVEQWGGLLGHEECPPICGLWANIWRGTGVMLRVSQPFVSLSKATAITEMIQRVASRNSTAFEMLLAELRADAPVRAMQARHPTAPLWACLSAHMLSHVPCSGAIRGKEYATLARRWAQVARSSTPEAIAQWVLQLGNAESGQPFSAAERFAIYWTMSICGKGQKSTPFWEHSPVGPDGLLSALACILGHKTIVLAASANDNGLLHQELVDFELPPPLGWPSALGSATNDVRQCLTQKAFGFVEEDRLKGTKARASRRRQMLDFWRASGKFALPTDPMTPQAAGQRVVTCALAFGRTDGAGSPNACVGPKHRTPANDLKACWAHCNGTLSRTVLASASLGHVFMHA